MYLFFLIILLNACSSAEEIHRPEVHTIVIKQMKFLPAELTVEKGDTVVWINEDLVTHDVTEEVNKTWTSSALPVGQSWSMAVSKSSNYYCSIHQVMKGKLVVK
jgi:plastocyanin